MPEPTSSAADEFFAGALKRIRKYMVVLSAAGLVVCLVFFRWPVAAGFLARSDRLLRQPSLAGARGRCAGRAHHHRRKQGAGRRNRPPRGAAIRLHRQSAPMLYLMFLLQVFTASWGAFVFRLQPWPAKSQWKCLSPCGADSDFLNNFDARTGRRRECVKRQSLQYRSSLSTSKPSCLSNFG